MTDITFQAVFSRLKKESIVSIDPGDSTGVYILEPFNTGYHATYTYPLFLEWLRRIQLYPKSSFVIEQFISRPGLFAKNQAGPKVCGAVDLFCLQNDIPLYHQSPQVIKTTLPDAKEFRKARWTWSNPHEFDALRHAVYYLLTR